MHTYNDMLDNFFFVKEALLHSNETQKEVHMKGLLL
jgi:hypothetical protein